MTLSYVYRQGEICDCKKDKVCLTEPGLEMKAFSNTFITHTLHGFQTWMCLFHNL